MMTPGLRVRHKLTGLLGVVVSRDDRKTKAHCGDWLVKWDQYTAPSGAWESNLEVVK